MKLKEFGIFCLFVGILVTIFIALTTTWILPKTVIPLFDGFVIVTVFSIFVFYIMFSYLLDTKRMNYHLELKKSQLETIFNNVDIALFLRDLDGTILAMNQCNTNLLGYTADEMIGKNIKDIIKNLDEVIDSTDKEIIENKKIVKYTHFVESNKGIGKHLKIGKFPFLDSKGKVSKLIVCYIDDTLEQNIEKTKNDFIETLTHDLRTPTITQIKALDMLLEGYFGELSEGQTEIVNQIKSSCKYMNDLIFTILDTYVIEKGNIKLNLSNLNMSNLVREITQELKWLAHEKNKSMFVDIDNASNFIRADRLQLKRVIFNLVSNAIKYGENDSVIDIVVKEVDDKYIDFQVRNKSEFLTEKDLTNIFDKYKSKSNSKISKISTGLGLYLSKQIVEKHKGEIYAKCTDKDTCIFGFKIPKDCNKEA
mgnify:CR=1 FL=1